MPVRRERAAAIGEDRGTMVPLLAMLSCSDTAMKYGRKTVERACIAVGVYYMNEDSHTAIVHVQ